MSIALLFISLALGLIGVVWETTDKDKPFPGRIKFFGYVVIGLLLISFVLTLLARNQDSRNQDVVAQTAYIEIRNANFELLANYFPYTDPPWASPDEFDFDRPLKEYSDLEVGTSILTFVCELDYRLEYRNSGRPIAYVLSEEMQSYRRRLNDVSARYQSYLPHSLVVKLSQATTHPWVEFHETLETRFDRARRDMSPDLFMQQVTEADNHSSEITCGDERDRAEFIAMGERFNKLLLEIEDQMFNEMRRIRRRGIPAEEEHLFERRPFWYD